MDCDNRSCPSSTQKHRRSAILIHHHITERTISENSSWAEDTNIYCKRMTRPNGSRAATHGLLVVLWMMFCLSFRRSVSTMALVVPSVRIPWSTQRGYKQSQRRSISHVVGSTTQDETEITATTVSFDMDDIIGLCKRRGFIFPSSEIYNGYAGFYDYGPLGVELKRAVKDFWWRTFVTSREDVVGLDSSIIHNPMTWKSSGTFAIFFSPERD